jgi:RNA polymerase sigma-70 factor (ECF subfamily)
MGDDTIVQLGRWLPAARAGSREALGRVLESCRGYLLLIARQKWDRALRAKSSPSDLVQQTFLEAQKDLTHFQGDAPEAFLAWMRQLLLNNLANHRRDFRRAKRRAALEVPLTTSDALPQSAGALRSGANSPGLALLRDEETEALERALKRLPADYRCVVHFRYREERSFETIAEMMERTPNAVRKLWARAIKKLQQNMDAPP